MVNPSKEDLQERAVANLALNLPFFYAAFKINLQEEPLDQLSDRISREFAFPTTATTLAIILGIHSPNLVSFAEQWEAYVNYCIRGMGNFYIPFMDDEVSDGIYRGTATGYVTILKSSVYPSGRLVKRVIPEDVVNALKDQVAA